MRRSGPGFGVLCLAVLFNICPTFAFAGGKLDFGNYTSAYLVHQGWNALTAKDYDAAIAYTQKTLELYSKIAGQMQQSLRAYASGSSKNIFQYWALNDVGTALVIEGDAYQAMGKKQEALGAFQTIMERYSFAQCWDPHGWFWKPADVARDKLKIAALGIDADFGNYDSNSLVQKAWIASAKRQLPVVKLYVDKVVELYGARALQMQSSIKYADASSLGYSQNTFNYWALNDVGTALFILADTYLKAGHKKEADAIYWQIIKEYGNAQCWKPLGGFWKPAEVAQKRLERTRHSLFGGDD